MTAKPPMYNDIWEQLKRNKTVRVAVHSALHRRIIHAVINKKYYDTGYKFRLAEQSKIGKITYKCSSNLITFTLTETWNFKSMSVNQL